MLFHSGKFIFCIQKARACQTAFAIREGIIVKYVQRMLKNLPYATTMVKILYHPLTKVVSLSSPPVETSRSLITSTFMETFLRAVILVVMKRSMEWILCAYSIKFAKALALGHSIHHILVKDLETNHIFRGDF